MFTKLKKKILFALRLSDQPQVKLYNGYGNRTTCVIFGHVFSISPLPRRRYRQNFLSNTLALLRLFIVRPVNNAGVQMKWENKSYTTKTAKDGFFRFEWSPSTPLPAGYHTVEVELLNGSGTVTAKAKASVLIPHYNQFAFISDIDDTFLISHSANLRKRLFVLLTENARSREPFEGVVNHYNLLSLAGAPDKTTNPFFYVSSSEWNLYNYILEFSGRNKLPDGIYLLNQIKTFSQILKTGQNNHGTKFMRIARIMEAYPEQSFILLGDDTQEDPYIYTGISQHFPGKIKCVYIRQVSARKEKVEQELAKLSSAGIYSCYFKHSSEAVIHSRQLGLIKSVAKI
jgi:phosphatidate phosphatase APP1